MSDLAKFLVEQGGLWGVIALGLGGALLYLEKDRQKLRTQLDLEHAARLNDAKENTKAMLEVSNQTREAIDRLASMVPPPNQRRL
jgi:hypothetical protein